MINDTTHGRLHITNVDLPERFDAGDLIFMDPRVFHSVSSATRDEKRKIVGFNFQNPPRFAPQ